MLDHLLIYAPANVMQKVVSFYTATLAPLGYTKTAEFAGGMVIGLADSTKHPNFWITSTGIDPSGKIQPGYCHLAFSAKEQKLVDECYAKGLEAGGKDNGPPGPRPQYHADYYAGFLFDPAGNNMEIVYRAD